MLLDNQLIAKIIVILNTGFASISNLVPVAPTVAQSNQPEQLGANTEPTIYLYKIGPDQRMGWPQRSYVWDQVNSREVFTTTQQYASTFQASCWATQNPRDTASLTASDLANYGAYIMQSQACIDALEAIGCGILNVNTVRNPVFSDDRQRFEFAPSFDFTITHKQIITQITPIITETILQILDV